MNESGLALSLIYVDRMLTRSNIKLTERNVHRFCLTSAMIASKFLQDDYYNNAHWAKIGGVTVVELNNLELAFLTLLTFDLFVDDVEYANYRNGITRKILVLSL
jgi:hypothetical protein